MVAGRVVASDATRMTDTRMTTTNCRCCTYMPKGLEIKQDVNVLGVKFKNFVVGAKLSSSGIHACILHVIGFYDTFRMAVACRNHYGRLCLI